MAKTVEEVITEIISNTVRTMRGLDIELTPDLSLIESGILDSMSVVNVVQGLQDAFDIEIMVGDISLDNFDTVELITQYVKTRIA